MPSRPASPELPVALPGATPPITKHRSATHINAEAARAYVVRCQEKCDRLHTRASIAYQDCEVVARAYELIDNRLKLCDAATFLPKLRDAKGRVSHRYTLVNLDLRAAEDLLVIAERQAAAAEADLAQLELELPAETPEDTPASSQ